MNARCSICLETFSDDVSPMTTVCGHLYCLDCATYNFAAQNATCAICRQPHTLDALIRLYPDYQRGPPRSSSSARRPYVQNVGVDVLEACNLVLESENVLESTALGLALARYVSCMMQISIIIFIRTDDLVEALVDHERDSPDIRVCVLPYLDRRSLLNSSLRIYSIIL